MQGAKKERKLPLPATYSALNMTNATALPAAFDSRERWGKDCPSVLHVRDQAACGSCWAHGSTEAFNDRVCIASGFSKTELLSTEHLTSCCDMRAGCFSFGCQGGDISSAWWFLTKFGVVTGGDFGDKKEFCWPYDVDPKSKVDADTPACRSSCENSNYGKSFSKDMANVKGKAFSEIFGKVFAIFQERD